MHNMKQLLKLTHYIPALFTGCWKLQGISGGFLVQPPHSKQGQWQPAVQGCILVEFGYLSWWRLHNLSGLLVPVFDQPHIKRGSFSPIQMEFPVFQFAPVVSCLLCVNCVSSEVKEEIILSSQNEIFLEQLSKFASFLSAKSSSKLGWRCKVLAQGGKRNLSTDTLAEAQKVKLSGVKAGIFTIDSNEQTTCCTVQKT